MTQPVSIRPLAARDRPEWTRLWTAYLEFYETVLGDDVYGTAFSRLLDDDPHEFRGFIAELDGKPVGLVHFVYHRTLWAVEDTCYLMDLFTDPACRGKGVARALINAVTARAKADGVPSVYWMTQEFNYKGRMLYDQVAERTPFIVYEIHDKG